MNKLKDLASTFLKENDPDCIGISIIDFTKKSFSNVELIKKDENILEIENSKIYYDLASLTKVFTNGITYLDDPSKISNDLYLLLNHRAGLVPYGELNKSSWKEDIFNLKTQESETAYSDFSAIRFMLEYEKEHNLDEKSVASKYWDKEMFFWKDLPSDAIAVQNGMRAQKPIIGEVHDPRAYNVGEFVPHAGIFSTLNGVSNTLLKLDSELGLLKNVKKKIEEENKQYRFSCGWDRVEDTSNTMAGSGCSDYTFGHLGFTGTSIWIDPVKMKGHVILTNATKNYWYKKEELNILRKNIGKYIWEQK